MSTLYPNSVLEDQSLKRKRLVFEFKITANATPASKVHSSDLPGVCVLSTEGKTAELLAIEDISGESGYTAPVDNSSGDSVFDVLIKGSEIGSIKKVYSLSCTEQTALASSVTLTKFGSNGLTAGGNISLEVAGAGLNLASESPTFLVVAEVLLSE